MISVALVGLPNEGKSTFFKAITGDNVLIEDRAYSTIEPNIKNIEFIDSRLLEISRVYSGKIIYPIIKIVDIGGIEKNASERFDDEISISSKFVSKIRECDIICHVVKFQGNIEEIKDKFNLIRNELKLCDLKQVKKSFGKIIKPEKKSKEKPLSKILFSRKIDRINNSLIEINPEETLDLNEEEQIYFSNYNFLTSKPYIILINEDTISNWNFKYNKEEIFPEKTIFINALIEGENNDELKKIMISGGNYAPFDKDLFFLKLKNNLNIKIFFTVKSGECKGWIAKKNFNAKECASLIHTDIGKRFKKVKIMTLEGKVNYFGENYLINDGDICEFF